MLPLDSLLVILVRLVDQIPMPPPVPRRGRGRPKVYSDRLFLKALVIMILRQLHTVHEFLTVLAQPTVEMQTLRAQLTDMHRRFPSRRTWERRLATIPDTLPGQIGRFGRALVELLQPWLTCGRAAAIDSTVLRARGGVWHKKDREAGIVPHTSIDTEANWTQSGWHGWVYGWKLHLVCTCATVWIPLAADLRFLLGHQHYQDGDLESQCAQRHCILVATDHIKGHPYPHRDPGVEVRRILHKTRSLAIENFNEQFKGIFDGHGQVPTKGLQATRPFALSAIFVYQLTLLYRHQIGADLRVGLKPFLKAA